jgi:hypothetical protein
MENRNTILSELQALRSTLSSIGPVNPYQIPEGYFQGFSSNMLELVKPDQPSEVLAAGRQNPYTVPDNYFAKLPEQILSFVKHEGVPPLLKDMGINNPYQVPQGYFEGLAGSILNRLKAQETDSPREELEFLSPVLSKLDKKIPFSSPAGYFDELTGNVVAGMKAIDFVNEELENLSPLMSSIKNNNVYSVPPDYFDRFPGTILTKLKDHKPTKVVSMSFGKKLMKYAAAAIVAGIIITAGILFLDKKDATVQPGTLSKSEETLKLETAGKLKALSDDELSNFIENQNASLPDILSVATSTELDSEDVKLMLADISDSELKRYLVEYSDTKEVLTN